MGPADDALQRTRACPHCDSTRIYTRKTTDVPYRCAACGAEFETPATRTSRRLGNARFTLLHCYECGNRFGIRERVARVDCPACDERLSTYQARRTYLRES